MKQSLILNITILLLEIFSAPKPIFALDSPSATGYGLGCGEGFGPIARFICTLSGDKSQQTIQVANKVNAVISSFIGFLTIVAAIWFLFQIILAGYQWIGAGGDKESVSKAQNKMTNSIIGLVIITTAWVIIGLIGKILGLDMLNPGAALQTLGL